MLSIGKLAIQLTTPLLLRKPCKLFASIARVCQRQLGFLVIISSSIQIIHKVHDRQKRQTYKNKKTKTHPE